MKAESPIRVIKIGFGYKCVSETYCYIRTF